MDGIMYAFKNLLIDLLLLILLITWNLFLLSPVILVIAALVYLNTLIK